MRSNPEVSCFKIIISICIEMKINKTRLNFNCPFQRKEEESIHWPSCTLGSKATYPSYFIYLSPFSFLFSNLKCLIHDLVEAHRPHYFLFFLLNSFSSYFFITILYIGSTINFLFLLIHSWNFLATTSLTQTPGCSPMILVFNH